MGGGTGVVAAGLYDLASLAQGIITWENFLKERSRQNLIAPMIRIQTKISSVERYLRSFRIRYSKLMQVTMIALKSLATGSITRAYKLLVANPRRKPEMPYCKDDERAKAIEITVRSQ